MTSGLVSVIIPTYNRAQLVCRAINSVRSQTYQNWEILVVDDGSRDDTPVAIARQFGSDPRVRYVYQVNGGVCSARNNGLARASGDFVAFLDSDDLWEPWKLELQVACLERFPDAGMIWTNMMAVDGQGTVLHAHYLETMYRSRNMYTDDQLFDVFHPVKSITAAGPPSVQQARLGIGNIFSQMVTGSLVHTSTVLLRRSLQQKIGGFNPELAPAGEDFDFHLRTCRESRVAFVDVSSVRYQIGEGDQLTSSKYSLTIAHNFLRTILPVIERDRALIQLPQRTIDQTLAYAHGWYGRQLVRSGQLDAGRQHLRAALKHAWSNEAAMVWVLSLLPERTANHLRSLFGRAKMAP